ncbi:MAG: 4-hydroxy-tetrahydrodipicolinate reductase [Gammaproteobacteria bacterium]|jgi:4-hydroxy-tetrahydrodipicolinate reductase
MSETAMNVGICGAAGRMGRTLLEAIAGIDDMALGGAFEHAGHAALGTDAGVLAGTASTGIVLRSDVAPGLTGLNTVVEFTLPEPTLEHIELCRSAGVQMVIGTTGFTAEQRAVIERAADDIAIVLAPNMSVGVNLTFKLIELASRVLGDDVDIEIIEAHHRHKVDAPSGTAVRMGEIIADTLGRDLSKVAVYGREGHTGERKRETIGFETIRAGDLVGEHTVMFAGVGERIEVTHRASSRMNFALGAFRAARWLRAHDTGLYDMHDVLGLREI